MKLELDEVGPESIRIAGWMEEVKYMFNRFFGGTLDVDRRMDWTERHGRTDWTDGWTGCTGRTYWTDRPEGRTGRKYWTHGPDGGFRLHCCFILCLVLLHMLALMGMRWLCALITVFAHLFLVVRVRFYGLLFYSCLRLAGETYQSNLIMLNNVFPECVSIDCLKLLELWEHRHTEDVMPNTWEHDSVPTVVFYCFNQCYMFSFYCYRKYLGIYVVPDQFNVTTSATSKWTENAFKHFCCVKTIYC